MKFTIIQTRDWLELEALLLKDGMVVPAPYAELSKFPQEALSQFCVEHGLYQIPTIELIDFLLSEIPDKSKAIEIGAGNGCVGRALGIRMTDNKMQLWPEIKAHYESVHQAVVEYGEDVEEISGNQAAIKYKPETIVACWVTHKWKPGMSHGNASGVEEEKLFKGAVKKYIHVGNEGTHGEKPILKKIPHKKIKFPWLLSRSMRREDNVIYIFTNTPTDS